LPDQAWRSFQQIKFKKPAYVAGMSRKFSAGSPILQAADSQGFRRKLLKIDAL
jgi:hypothetical protein